MESKTLINKVISKPVVVSIAARVAFDYMSKEDIKDWKLWFGDAAVPAIYEAIFKDILAKLPIDSTLAKFNFNKELGDFAVKYFAEVGEAYILNSAMKMPNMSMIWFKQLVAQLAEYFVGK